MIERIQLARFKRFTSLDLHTRALTVLTGTNGSGKTSVMHALLLARQASIGTPDIVELNGPHGLQLGESTSILHHEASPSDGLEVGVRLGGKWSRWRFSPSKERTLVLDITNRPPDAPHVLTARDRKFTYISADRLGPRDTLPAAAAPISDLGVGARGEYVAHVLAVLDRQKVSEGRRLPEVKPPGLQHQLEGWMKAVARPLEIRAEWFPGSAATMLLFKTPGLRHDWVRPPNMGFGISSVLPILVAGLVAEKGGLLLVENPEIHLHPASQSAIGRFLAQIAADGVQVVVETHSDHVLNGVRRSVAEGVVSPDATVIHFFDDEVTEVRVDGRGKLSEWPAGFFDQLERDLGAIARKQRKSQRKGN